MTTAVRVHTSIVDSTVEYLNTAYLTKYDDFNDARVRLVRDLDGGPMFREPLYEVQDRYPSSGQTIERYLRDSKAVPGIHNDAELALIAAALSGVVRGDLYAHQVAALRNVSTNLRASGSMFRVAI
jgi:hypothetical protein